VTLKRIYLDYATKLEDLSMRIFINSAFIVLLLLNLAGCANTDPGVSLSATDVDRLMAANDNLIVPGERIGPVFIGMTETQLYQKLGNPSTTTRGDDGTWVRYEYDSLVLGLQVNPSTHKVNYVDNYFFGGNRGNVENFPYSTREGITVGSSELQIQTLPWKLYSKQQGKYAPQCWTFQYTGIRISTCNGKVTSIGVHSPN
jgi:hypothetical protein